VSEPQKCTVSNQSMYFILDNGFKLKLVILRVQFFFKVCDLS